MAQAGLLGRAAETTGINGIFVSPVDGLVYASSVGGNELTIHDPESGALLDRIGADNGVTGPDDLFITEDGTIYWTELTNGHVGMLAPDGELKRQFVGPGVNPITMSDDGRLFVARTFFGPGLYELDPNLDAEPVVLNGDLFGLNAFDFGPDGLLYAPSQFTGEIVKIDVDADVPQPEVVASGFAAPTAAKFDSSGVLHINDLSVGQVWRLDLEGGDRELLLDIEGTTDNIAFDADDRLFVAAGSDNQIIRVDDGQVGPLGEPGLGTPGGVAVTPDGMIWVADFFAVRGFEPGSEDWSSSIYNVSGATVAADGDRLITTSMFPSAVQILDPATGTVVQQIVTLAMPTNAIRHGEVLVAAQVGAGNVVNAEDPSQVFIDELAIPLGLASDGTTLYVGDNELGNIWAVDGDGATLLASELSSPEGIALDGDRLLVVEVSLRQVTAIDLVSGERSVVIEGLDFSDPIGEGGMYGLFSGVAVAADGSIYVSDDGRNQVYEFGG